MREIYKHIGESKVYTERYTRQQNSYILSEWTKNYVEKYPYVLMENRIEGDFMGEAKTKEEALARAKKYNDEVEKENLRLGINVPLLMVVYREVVKVRPYNNVYIIDNTIVS